MAEPPQTETGIFADVTRLLQTLRDVAQNRVELFLVELQEERVRLFDALLLLAVGIVCTLMTLIVLTFTVVLIFWDTHRLLVLTLVTVAYAAGTVTSLVKLRSGLQRWETFSATLQQLKKDRSCFKKPD